jgi:hypothetical protein
MFNRARAMRAFLLYITEQAFLGNAENLKEQAIGAEVLGRKGDYDPAVDNIVRVRAHELRERLEKHFSTEGAEEPIILTVPKGCYIPEFTPRKSILLEKPEQVPTPPAPPVLPQQKVPPLHHYWLPFTLILLAAVFTTALLTRYLTNSRARSIAGNDAIRDFWGQFFDKSSEELRVVYADTSFALWQDLTGKSLDLGEYLSRNSLAVSNDELREVATRRATSPADVYVSVRLAALATEFGGKLDPEFARNVSADSLQHSNGVLLGSRRSNPWLEIYENNLNFVLERDPHTGAPLFRNRAPQPQEADTYSIPTMLDVQGDEQREFTSFALVALLKGCGDRGLTVIDEGLNMQATQAAGDLITDPQRLDMLLHSIGHTPGTKVVPFEALIQIKSLPGGYENPRVIAFRVPRSAPCIGK